MVEKSLMMISMDTKREWFQSGKLVGDVAYYVDYLERNLRNLHYQTSLVARAAGGGVPDMEEWDPDREVSKKRKREL